MKNDSFHINTVQIKIEVLKVQCLILSSLLYYIYIFIIYINIIFIPRFKIVRFWVREIVWRIPNMHISKLQTQYDSSLSTSFGQVFHASTG